MTGDRCIGSTRDGRAESVATPGPWAALGGVVSAPEQPKETLRSGRKATRRIATIHPCYSLEQHKANARLIAAAPELLEALQTMFAALAHHDHWQPTMPAHLQDIARAAIAKAGG